MVCLKVGFVVILVSVLIFLVRVAFEFVGFGFDVVLFVRDLNCGLVFDCFGCLLIL